MGFSISRVAFTYMNNTSAVSSITGDKCLAYTLWNDMIGNGFTLLDSDTRIIVGNQSTPTITTSTTQVILKPTVSVDPLIDSQDWVVVMKLVDAQGWPTFKSIGGSTTAAIQTGTTTTGQPVVQSFPNSGLSINCIPVSNKESPQLSDSNISSASLYPIVPPVTNNDSDPTPRLFPGRPYGYVLTIVPRGFVINIYDQTSTENINLQGTFCVQRAMTCGGTMVDSGNTPLYLVTNVSMINTDTNSTKGISWTQGPQNSWFSQIIREDNVTSTFPEIKMYGNTKGPYYDNESVSNNQLLTTSISDTRDYTGHTIHRFPIRWNAPVTNDSGEYILVFPYGSCSSRYAYMDEIDLIAVSKADAYQNGQYVPLNVYGDSRKYLALNSNNAQYSNNSGIRVFIMVSGKEIT